MVKFWLNNPYELLNKQNIISVFHGGAESGRRALGNRSILADPRSPDMKDLINEKKFLNKYSNDQRM